MTRAPLRRAAGFTYLAVLFVVAIMGVGLALVGQTWHTAAMRDKEAELLYVGDQYRKAIERYYLADPRLRLYPRDLELLLRDPRKPGVERYLRKLYPDPMTGKDWVLVRAPDGGIAGVHSASEAEPLKSANFSPQDAGFEKAKKYSDWVFAYTAPSTPAPAAKPAAKPTAGR